MRFQSQCIYRIVAGTYREALLAGFPPEAVKCHQIPDLYAIASLTQFSRPAQRVTPVDWNLNAGTGYGFTRYGVWYQEEHNAAQGGHSSGQDLMVIGEYQSLTPDVEQAYQQLRYLRDHGVEFIHCMQWPEGHDQGYNAALTEALTRLAADDVPRPGIPGGTGQLRVWRDGGRTLELVSLGTGPGHTGLIKSIDSEGAWEGSVYVVPFHSHVEVTPLAVPAEADLAKPLDLGRFEHLGAGNVVELSARVAARGDRGELTLRVYHGDTELPGCRLVVPVARQPRPVRLLVRVQMDTDSLRVRLDGAVRLTGLQATLQAEQTTKLKQGIFAGRRHAGGVTFDALPAP
ncbi:MAG: hypothetical protein HYU66_26540 [Armatimonadetes bacterium]|nr:hypothetical protein [Armatimonadota bacterium]